MILLCIMILIMAAEGNIHQCLDRCFCDYNSGQIFCDQAERTTLPLPPRGSKMTGLTVMLIEHNSIEKLPDESLVKFHFPDMEQLKLDGNDRLKCSEFNNYKEIQLLIDHCGEHILKSSTKDTATTATTTTTTTVTTTMTKVSSISIKAESITEAKEIEKPEQEQQLNTAVPTLTLDASMTDASEIEKAVATEATTSTPTINTPSTTASVPKCSLLPTTTVETVPKSDCPHIIWTLSTISTEEYCNAWCKTKNFFKELPGKAKQFVSDAGNQVLRGLMYVYYNTRDLLRAVKEYLWRLFQAEQARFHEKLVMTAETPNPKPTLEMKLQKGYVEENGKRKVFYRLVPRN